MKTKYLDNEIELLNAIKRNDELSDYGKEKLSEFNAIKQALTIPVVSESTLTVPDIRNKLSPITHLISMVEREEPYYIKKAIPQAKKSVNYLAQRDVYSR